jgi:hypothetical protein
MADVAEKVADLLAGRLARDPHAGSGGTTIDEGADHVNPVAGLPGALAAAHGGEGQRRRVESGVAAVDIGSRLNEQTDHIGVPDVRRPVQRLLVEIVAGVGRETHIEHQGDDGDRSRAGCLDDYSAVLVSQPVAQVGVLGEEMLSRPAVGAPAGPDEAIDVGTVIRRAAAHQQSRVLALAGLHRPTQGREVSVAVLRFGVGSAGQKGGDDFGRSIRRRGALLLSESPTQERPDPALAVRQPVGMVVRHLLDCASERGDGSATWMAAQGRRSDQPVRSVTEPIAMVRAPSSPLPQRGRRAGTARRAWRVQGDSAAHSRGRGVVHPR